MPIPKEQKWLSLVQNHRLSFTRIFMRHVKLLSSKSDSIAQVAHILIHY
jgi:hypothetical protein